MRAPASFVQRWLRLRQLVALVLGAAVAALVLAIRASGGLTAVEFDVYDALVRATTRGSQADARIALIHITESDLRRFDHPLSDDVLAQGIEVLLAAGPRAVGIDVYRDRSVGEGEVRLRAVLEHEARAVLVHKVGDSRHDGIPTLPYLAPHQRGFSDMLPDPDGVARRGLLYLWEGDAAHISLSLQLASRYLAHEKLGVGPVPGDPGAIQLGSTPLPPVETHTGSYVGADAGGYQFMLDFEGAQQPLATYTYADLIDGAVDPAALRGRIVLLGTAAPSVKDQFTTPVNLQRVGDRVMYGVDLHGYATSQLLRTALDGAKPLTSPSEALEAAWVVAWSLLAAWIGLRLRAAAAFAGVVGGGLLAIAGIGYAAFESGLWIPVVPPAAGWLGAASVVVAYQSQRERAERNLIMRVFARYEGRKVADALWERRDEFMDGGSLRPQRLTLTILMADLEGYTATAESMDPEELLGWINGFMGAMARLVEAHGGAVDDYAGDGIKANFGVPTPRLAEEEIDADARAAVRCALDMAQEMERLSRSWSEAGLPTGRLRVGIHTGSAVVGEIGSEDRASYKSVGDTANTAARLEGFDKEAFGAEDAIARVLVSEETQRRIGPTFATERIGAFPLKGKREPIAIFRVEGETADVSPGADAREA